LFFPAAASIPASVDPAAGLHHRPDCQYHPAFPHFRDIFQRPFDNSNTRYLWLAIILLFWPAGLIYLLRHGFKPR